MAAYLEAALDKDVADAVQYNDELAHLYLRMALQGPAGVVTPLLSVLMHGAILSTFWVPPGDVRSRHLASAFGSHVCMLQSRTGIITRQH